MITPDRDFFSPSRRVNGASFAPIRNPCSLKRRDTLNCLRTSYSHDLPPHRLTWRSCISHETILTLLRSPTGD